MTWEVEGEGATKQEDKRGDIGKIAAYALDLTEELSVCLS